MSFILDALKKSESERQRQSGPALFEVKVAPPRSRVALWVSILGALLLVNGIGLGWLLMHGSTAHSTAASVAASAPAAATPPGVVPPAYAAPAAQSSRAVAAASGGAPTPSAAAGAPTTPPAAPVESAANGRPAAAAAPSVAAAGTAQNPDDLAPAVDPARPGAGAPNAVAATDATADATSGVVRATASGLPTYQDAAAARGANLPELRLDLHSYSPRPDERFIFLNMTKLREGDALPQGVRVESITPDGVILSYQGTKFVLQRQ